MTFQTTVHHINIPRLFLREGTLGFRDLIVRLEMSCPMSGTSEINSKLSRRFANDKEK